jgi:hypothetical protein
VQARDAKLRRVGTALIVIEVRGKAIPRELEELEGTRGAGEEEERRRKRRDAWWGVLAWNSRTEAAVFAGIQLAEQPVPRRPITGKPQRAREGTAAFSRVPI